MEISELRERQNLSDDKKLKKAFSNFKTLLKELKNNKLTDSIIKSINQDIEELNSTSFTDKKSRRLIEKKQKKILSSVEKELKIVPKKHYLFLGMAVGISIGMMLGTVIGLSLDNIGLIGIGLPVGLGIGLAIGAKMDKKAFDEGRQLNLEIKL